MKQDWYSIWNKKDRLERLILEFMMKADGFDSPTGQFPINIWEKYTSEMYELMGIKSGAQILEIGCGSGAFLYPLYLQNINVTGVDYSKELIDIAKKFFRNSNFYFSDALDYVNSETKLYNFVLSHGVFLYFPDLNYSERVLDRMIDLSKNKVMVMDICDADKEQLYKEDRIKKYQEQGLSEEEYEKKYSGLNHLFFKKDWFVNHAKKRNLKIKIFDQKCNEYYNSRYRFNVILEH